MNVLKLLLVYEITTFILVIINIKPPAYCYAGGEPLMAHGSLADFKHEVSVFGCLAGHGGKVFTNQIHTQYVDSEFHCNFLLSLG